MRKFWIIFYAILMTLLPVSVDVLLYFDETFKWETEEIMALFLLTFVGMYASLLTIVINIKLFVK